MTASRSLIDVFARHPLAANLVMVMMILSGLWAATRINTQLDPSVEWPVIFVNAEWPGASAQDIEQLIVMPVEQQLRTLNGLQTMTSSSRNGSAIVRLEFRFDTDLNQALNQVEDRVGQVRNLPAGMEPLLVRRTVEYEPIASVLVSSRGTVDELLPLLRRFERELYQRGIDRIDFQGLPEQEIAVQVSSDTLMAMNTTLDELAAEISRNSLNAPAGTVARRQGEMQLRSLEQKRDPRAFEQMPVGSAGQRLTRLGEIADVDRRARPGQPALTRNGRPTVEMNLYRVTDSDAITAAEVLEQWLADTRPELPDGVELHVYQEVWVLLEEQLSVIFKNAASGLLLVIATLFLFLNGRVGWWVMIGIPVSFLFAGLIYYTVFGGSINILALVTFIMALGIVVDDAIVVGEDAVNLHEQGLAPDAAATGAAKRMFAPVVTSSLTTLAAFVPLIVVGGEVGAIIQTMPMVLFCVIVASLVECFLVLPGHLGRSLEHVRRDRHSGFRHAFDRRFFAFRDRFYRPLLAHAIKWPGVTLWTSLGCVVLAFSLIASGRLGVNFVTGVGLEMLEANVAFHAEASPSQRERFLGHLEETLLQADEELGGNNINGYVARFNTARLHQEQKNGSRYGSLRVEYAWDDSEAVPARALVDAWRERVEHPSWVEELQLEVQGGANGGGPDMSLVLRGPDINTLKRASQELQSVIASYEGVTNVYDNLPWGNDQIIFSLTPQGHAVGLTTAELGRQLRGAYNGSRVQIFNQNDTETEVLVTLPESEREDIASLNRFPVRTPGGDMLPLHAIATLDKRRGIDVVNHSGGEPAVLVSAHVDSEINNATRVLASVRENDLPPILRQYGLESGLGGVSEVNQQIVETLSLGAVLTLIFIYLILCWAFASWLWPLAVLTTIPLGMTGAIAGHWIMGADIGVFSMLAFFALTGVVVNDAIVLISFFRRELDSGKPLREAIETAAMARFRAVVLTSLTTIAGLSPLMFEDFSMAVFMVPVAITLCFGLAFATLLVLLVIPALMVLAETMRESTRRGWSRLIQNLAGRFPARPPESVEE